ncbi:DNA-3-methyladenine glycosylase 2 family protein [Prolixibacteraceae bacterium JC049]|nr:DNA-3-methyladenine glycosylase 2 family protein [Prolixibacteraceae bacterium JC049]
MSQAYFKYGQKEIDYLKSKDPKLGAAIDRIGLIERSVTPDLFQALIHAIVGQQISTKAQQTIWQRMQTNLVAITPTTIAEVTEDELQKNGLSFRKVSYIKNIAEKVNSGELNLDLLSQLDDTQVCTELSKLDGIGKWTAEMIMLFSMQRPNILSFGDLAILRGMRMLYHHRTITPKLFHKYWRRYTPYASIASLYLWAISAGAIPELKDHAPKNIKK